MENVDVEVTLELEAAPAPDPTPIPEPVEVVDLSENEFKLTTTINAVTANPADVDLLAFEIDFTLENDAEALPKDSFVWLYASLKNKVAETVAESWETVACLV